MPNAPLVVAVLHADEDDKNYQLYGQAYGLEMQIDNEWSAEAVLLTPHDYLTSITEGTDVTGEDAVIVSAGVTDTPVKEDGCPDLSALSDKRNNWLLVAGPGNADAEAMIKAKLHSALGAGCRVILCFSEIDTHQLASRLSEIKPADLRRILIAFVGPRAAFPPAAERAMRFVRKVIGATADGPRLIVGGAITPNAALALLRIEGISGVFLAEDKYDHFGVILNLLAALAGLPEA
jgi:hypothetical protein